MREVLTVNVGQAGIQLGAAVWAQYCAEHTIEPTGKRGKDANEKDTAFKVFFEETSSGQVTHARVYIYTIYICVCVYVCVYT